MCSIVILKQSDSEWPIIIGANRDEMSNRDYSFHLDWHQL